MKRKKKKEFKPYIIVLKIDGQPDIPQTALEYTSLKKAQSIADYLNKTLREATSWEHYVVEKQQPPKKSYFDLEDY